MAKARPKNNVTELVPGTLAWASVWPDWEIDGEEHPILIVKVRDDGCVGILPLTTKPELSRYFVSVTRQFYPSAFKPTGLLTHDATVVCLAGSRGATMRWVRPGDSLLHFPNQSVTLRRITRLSPEDWQSLRLAILEEFQEMKRRGVI